MAMVTIKPKPGSRRFQAMQGMHNVHVVSQDGGKTQMEKTMGEYKGERFPKSRQIFRAQYSKGQRRWMLDGFEENSKELNDLVKKCRLKYEDDDHPKKGHYIEDCDIRDFDDPFFKHTKFRVMASEGEVLMDTSIALDRLLVAALKKNRMFQVGYGKTKGGGRAKYVILDKELDNKDKKTNRDKKLKAMKLFSALSDPKKQKLATILELVPPNSQTDRDLIDDVLFKFAENDEDNAVGTKMTKQDLFVKMCELDTEELNLDYKIARAKSLGFLKANQNGFILFGNPVGRSKDDIKSYLLDIDNQEMLMKLEQALNDKGN